MAARVTTCAATMVVLMLLLAGCADETQRIARDACDLMEDIVEDPAALDEDVFTDLQELEARADDAGISDAEMQEAMRDECPEVFESLNGVDF